MKKANKSEYDENGRWVEERARIKGAIRRTFRLSPQMKEVLQKSRVELPPAIKKDGNPGKKNQVRYKCNICSNLFSQKHVQVDHLVPVVPLWMPEQDMSYDQIVRGVFCHIDNLQVVCSTPMRLNNGEHSCHKKKTDEENFIRAQFKTVLNLRSHSLQEIEDLENTFRKQYFAYVEEREAKKREKLARRAAKRNKIK